MIKNKFFLILILLLSNTLVGCITPKAVDVGIDACKVSKPPKGSYVMELPHGGNSYTYPDLSKGRGNYTGCVKTWFGDDDYLLQTLWFVNGSISRVELNEPHQDKVICEFDNSKHIKSGPVDVCKDFVNLPDKN